MKKGLISKILAGGLAAAMAFGVLPSTVLAKETPLHCMLKNRDGFSLEEFKAIFSEHPEWINEKDCYGESSLSLVVKYERLDVLKYLVEECYTGVLGETLLRIAAIYGKLDIAKWLVEEKELDVNCVDADGNTLLHIACSSFYHDLEFIEWLVEKNKLCVNSKNNDGDTPLNLCRLVSSTAVSIRKFLIRYGGHVPQGRRKPLSSEEAKWIFNNY